MTQQDLLGLEPLPSLNPAGQRASFHPATRKRSGLALSQLQKSPSQLPSCPCAPPSHAPRQETRHRVGGVHLYHVVWMMFCKSLSLSAPVSSLWGIQGPVWPDRGSDPLFMSCHQFAGLSPGQSLVFSRLSSLLLSGLPGFHSKNVAKQTGSGQANEGDSRPKPLTRT